MALPSRQELFRTPTTTITFMFLLVVVVLLGMCTPLGAGAGAHFVGSESLKVSTSEFVGSVREVVELLQEVISILAEFDNGFGDFRVSNAVSDCLDLLDLSSDELDWSVSATESPQGTFVAACSNLCLAFSVKPNQIRTTLHFPI